MMTQNELLKYTAIWIWTSRGKKVPLPRREEDGITLGSIQPLLNYVFSS